MAEKNERMIAALRREREGFVRAGKDDRVALVDEQLKFYGFEPEEKPDPKKQAPQGRSAQPKQQQTKD
jgi:hypothetical protein